MKALAWILTLTLLLSTSAAYACDEEEDDFDTSAPKQQTTAPSELGKDGAAKAPEKTEKHTEKSTEKK